MLAKKINEFSIDDLDKALSHHSITKIPTPNPNKYFDKFRHFSVFGKEYCIIWWKNICYLHAGDGLIIPFKYVEASGTWPNHAKTNLQFYDDRGEICAILKIEYYKK